MHGRLVDPSVHPDRGPRKGKADYSKSDYRETGRVKEKKVVGDRRRDPFFV